MQKFLNIIFTMKKVIVGMSGGVDSSVTAYILKNLGYEVIGIFIKMHEFGDEFKVREICNKLQIGFEIIDETIEFSKYVIKYFIDTYNAGMTPNPCVRCNKMIKYSSLFKAKHLFNTDFVATGHYANIKKINNKNYLCKAINEKKDQSYFLYNIKKEYLDSLIFPLGKFNTKDAVKEISKYFSDTLATQKESQDICFIKNDYKKLLKNKEGNIVLSSGEVIGKHNGTTNFTCGQRKGIGIAFKEPLFVKNIDPINNTVIVGTKNELKSKIIIIKDVNLLVDNNFFHEEKLQINELSKALKYKIQDKDIFLTKHSIKTKLRYAGKSLCADVFITSDLSYGIIKLLDYDYGIATGQSAVLYDNNIVIGGGIISEVIYDN